MFILLPICLARRKRSTLSSAIASRRAASSSAVHPLLKFGSSALKYLRIHRNESVHNQSLEKQGGRNRQSDDPIRTDLDTACCSALERSSRSAAKVPSAGPHPPPRRSVLRPPQASKPPSWRTAIRRRTAPGPDSGKHISTCRWPL